MALTDELTKDYQSAGARSEVQPERIKVALVSGLAPHATHEIQTLLRRRLRIAFLLIAVIFGIGVLLYLVNIHLMHDHAPAVAKLPGEA